MANSVADAVVNPNDSTQRYVLWGNGRIDAIGGVPPVTGNATWYTRTDNPAKAIWVTNWTTGAGYVLDFRGRFSPFNGAPVLGTDGIVSGVPYTAAPNIHRYIHWAWDPAGTGQGYVLDVYGELLAFGGATATAVVGPRFPSARARRVYVQWTPSKKAYVMDAFGRLYGNYFTAIANARPATLGTIGPLIARDFQVIDWTTGAGYLMDFHGKLHSFNGAASVFGNPYSAADVARVLRVLSASNPARFLEEWQGGQEFEFISSTAPTVVAGGGVSEVQRVAITGSPTGGTFTLTFSGQTTTALAFNASAATVQAALIALSNIGTGDVVVTGGPGPATAWLVTFSGVLAYTDLAQMTATSSLTGGTTPAVAVTTTQVGEASSPAVTTTDTTRPVLAWDYTDPQGDSQSGWQLYVFTETFAAGHTMTDPSIWAASALVSEDGSDRTTRGITSPVDIANGQYRLYVRAKDTADLWSAWSSFSWTQNVAVPATPTGLTATANSSTYTVALSVTATTGGTATLVRFDASDDAGVTWAPVVGASAVPLLATTTATDRTARQGVTRTYRAVAYNTAPAVASLPSSTASATLSAAARQHVLTAVNNSALGGPVYVQDPISWSRPIVAGVFTGVGAKYPTVVSDGPPKARRGTLQLAALDPAAWTVIEQLLEADDTLLHRDPRGSAIYFRAVGDWTQAKMRMESGYTSDLPLVEIEPPAT